MTIILYGVPTKWRRNIIDMIEIMTSPHRMYADFKVFFRIFSAY